MFLLSFHSRWASTSLMMKRGGKGKVEPRGDDDYIADRFFQDLDKKKKMKREKILEESILSIISSSPSRSPSLEEGGEDFASAVEPIHQQHFLLRVCGLVRTVIGGPTWSRKKRGEGGAAYPRLSAPVLRAFGRGGKEGAAAAREAIAILALVATLSPVGCNRGKGGGKKTEGKKGVDVCSGDGNCPTRFCAASLGSVSAGKREEKLPRGSFWKAPDGRQSRGDCPSSASGHTGQRDGKKGEGGGRKGYRALPPGIPLAGRFWKVRVIYWLGLLSVLGRLVKKGGDLLQDTPGITV